MAKKNPTASRAPKSADATKSTGYTTRLSTEQGRVVEEAARLLDVTPAKFIRDAALGRALEVVNSQGENAVALRRIAEQLADRVLNPTIRLHLEAPDGTRFEQEIDRRTHKSFLPDEEPENIARAASYYFYENDPRAEKIDSEEDSFELAEQTQLLDVSFPDYPTEEEIRRFRQVYGHAGAQLIDLFLSTLLKGRSHDDVDFVPQIDPARLMAGGDADGD